MSSSVLEFISGNLLQFPTLVTFLVGVILTAIHRQRLRQAALVLGLGFGLLLIGGLVGLCNIYWFMNVASRETGAEAARVFGAVSAYAAMAQVAGQVALLVGIFGYLNKKGGGDA